MNAYDWIITGLALDLCGGLVLAKGFMLKQMAEAFRESRTIIGYNRFLLKSALVQKGEAAAGGGLLAVGFLLQMWGNFHGAPSLNELGWISTGPRFFAALVGAGLTASGIWWLGREWGRRLFYRFFFREFNKESDPVDGRGEELDRMAALYDATPRRRSEPDDAFAARLEGRRQELGRAFGPRGRG